MGRLRKPLRLGALGLGAAVLAASLALNVALLSGGAVAERASEAFEDVTGTRSAVSRHAAEVAALTDALAAEQVETQKLYGKVAQISNMLLLARETNRSIRERYVVLSDELGRIKAQGAPSDR
ncbi:MAG: hypothetical protein AAGG09_16130 [Pseudomonadota bacterium]